MSTEIQRVDTDLLKPRGAGIVTKTQLIDYIEEIRDWTIQKSHIRQERNKKITLNHLSHGRISEREKDVNISIEKKIANETMKLFDAMINIVEDEFPEVNYTMSTITSAKVRDMMSALAYYLS